MAKVVSVLGLSVARGPLGLRRNIELTDDESGDDGGMIMTLLMKLHKN